MLNTILFRNPITTAQGALPAGVAYESINIQTLIVEVLTENKVFSRFSDVRYHINLLKAESFGSDKKNIKDILKRLINHTFHFSKSIDDPQVKITAETQGADVKFLFWNNGKYKKEHVIDSIFQLKAIVTQLSGEISIISPEEGGILISVVLPNHYKLRIL